MSPPPTSSRRSFLGATGAVVFAGVAGCLGRPKYDSTALVTSLDDPIPRFPPATLPFAGSYLSNARDAAERSGTSLGDRLSSLPDRVSPESRLVEKASLNLNGGRTALSESTRQQSTDAMRSIREAKSRFGEGHGWLDVASGVTETDALRAQHTALARVLARSWSAVEYRATTVPIGIYVAAETESPRRRSLDAGFGRYGADRRRQ